MSSFAKQADSKLKRNLSVDSGFGSELSEREEAKNSLDDSDTWNSLLSFDNEKDEWQDHGSFEKTETDLLSLDLDSEQRTEKYYVQKHSWAERKVGQIFSGILSWIGSLPATLRRMLGQSKSISKADEMIELDNFERDFIGIEEKRIGSEDELEQSFSHEHEIGHGIGEEEREEIDKEVLFSKEKVVPRIVKLHEKQKECKENAKICKVNVQQCIARIAKDDLRINVLKRRIEKLEKANPNVEGTINPDYDDLYKKMTEWEAIHPSFQMAKSVDSTIRSQSSLVAGKRIRQHEELEECLRELREQRSVKEMFVKARDEYEAESDKFFEEAKQLRNEIERLDPEGKESKKLFTMHTEEDSKIVRSSTVLKEDTETTELEKHTKLVMTQQQEYDKVVKEIAELDIERKNLEKVVQKSNEILERCSINIQKLDSDIFNLEAKIKKFGKKGSSVEKTSSENDVDVEEKQLRRHCIARIQYSNMMNECIRNKGFRTEMAQQYQSEKEKLTEVRENLLKSQRASVYIVVIESAKNEFPELYQKYCDPVSHRFRTEQGYGAHDLLEDMVEVINERGEQEKDDTSKQDVLKKAVEYYVMHSSSEVLLEYDEDDHQYSLFYEANDDFVDARKQSVSAVEKSEGLVISEFHKSQPQAIVAPQQPQAIVAPQPQFSPSASASIW